MQNNPWQRPEMPEDPHDNWRQQQARHRRAQRWLRYSLVVIALIMLFSGLMLAFPAVSAAHAPYIARSTLMLLLLVSSFLLFKHVPLGQVAKMAGMWVVIIAAISGVYMITYDTDNRIFTSVSAPSANADGSFVVRRSRDGHFWLNTELNGVPLRMMVDTGASHIVLTREDAAKVGFDLDGLTYDLKARTANGTVRFARARAESFKVGHATASAVPVTINEGDMPGSLLGMSVLSEFSSVEFRGKEMILRP